MSTRINQNILSLTAQRNLAVTQKLMDQSVQRLSSGLRINSAGDDPAGLAVSERMRGQIIGMVEAERNANYDVNLLETAEGATSVIDEKLVRIRGLAVEAANGALIASDRTALNVEFQHLKSEITRIAQVVNYNGLKLLDGTYSSASITFHIGANATSGKDYYSVNLNSMTASSLGLSAINVSTTAAAQTAITAIDTAILSKDNERTKIGAYIERLQNTILSLQISHENAVKSESTIRDADIATEMSNFVKSQILMRSGVAMLSQSNLIPQTIASLVG